MTAEPMPEKIIKAAASEYLAAIVESSDDAIIGKDLNGIIISWNRGAEQMFGYTAAEALGKPISMLAAPEVLDEMPRILARIREGERVERYETVRCRKNGERINVSLTISPVRDDTGRIVGVSKIAHDITELKRAQLERVDLLARERAGREAAENAARLHAEAERNLALLVDASDRLLGSVETQDVLDRTLELAERFVAADAYAVWRCDSSTNLWRIQASRGLSDAYFREDSFLSSGTALGPQLIAIEDLDASPAFAARQAIYRREHVRALMASPMRIHQEWSATLTFYFRTVRSFPEAERRIAIALANLAASAISSADLYQEQKRLRNEAQAAAKRSNFLAQAAAALNATLDFSETLDNVARLAIPTFADWCAVDLMTASGEIERLAVQHADPAKVELAHQMRRRYPVSIHDPGGLGNALRTGEPVLYPKIPEEELARGARDPDHLEILKGLGMSSALIVPIIARGRVLGAITFVSAESGRRYTPDDLAMAELLALRAGLAIDNSELFSAAQRDRAELRTVVKALRESNAELEQFAYVSSHDLQEPLRTVASYTQLIARRYRGRLDADADQFFDHIVEGALRMNSLIDGLLTYSRLARIGGPPPEPVNTGEVLSRALGNLRKACEESGAQITHDELPIVRAHRHQLVQVFQNLISNAIKYRGSESPRVHISAVRDGGDWRFAIEDNGMGIEPQYWDRIFGLFKRLHGREIPGTGIGLATCKRILEQLGGRIWLESKPGEGTTFYFTLSAA